MADFDDGNGAQKSIERCKKIFVEQAAYWRSVVTGMLVLAGMSAGMIGWVMRVEARAAVARVKIEQLEVQTNEISMIASDLNKVLDSQDKIMQALKIRRP